MNLTEILILVSVGLALYGGHKFRWRVVPGVTDSGGKLHPIVAYLFGVSCILAGIAVWCYADGGDFTWFNRALSVATAAGIGTWLARQDEREIEHQARDGDIEDYHHGQTVQGR